MSTDYIEKRFQSQALREKKVYDFKSVGELTSTFEARRRSDIVPKK